MIHLDGINLTLNQIPVLRDVSLHLDPGTVTVVMGANGTGKSSLLKVTTGEWLATHGAVSLHGRDVSDWSARQRAKIMAVLPQASTLNFPYLVEEVVALGRTPHDTGIGRDREIVTAALARMDASHLSQRLYTELSGGEKQRVQLARVLAQIWEIEEANTPVLVLDEPTASLDIEHQLQMLETVRDLARQGYIVLLVLHDMNLAASCADQLVFMHCGAIAAQGRPTDVMKPDTIKAIFNVDTDVMQIPGRAAPVVVPK